MLTEILANLGRPRILVLGDVMLDRYIFGAVERISPEAPVGVLQAGGSEVRPGGAASVAYLLRRLGAEVSLAGVTGADADQQAITELLDDAGVEHGLLWTDPLRRTTVKQRFLGRTDSRDARQILRVDYETRAPVPQPLQQELAGSVAGRLDQYAAVLVSDYAKGLCTQELLARVIRAAGDRGVPVLVDPARIRDFSRYRGARLLKPNRVEAELGTGRTLATIQQAAEASQWLVHLHGFEAVLVTLGSQGMVLADKDSTSEIAPAAPRAVCDVTGAGDMVLAVLGLAVASEISVSHAARLANLAAGLEVERLGVAPVSRTEILAALARRPSVSPPSVAGEKHVTLDQMCHLAGHYRRVGRTVVLSNGCFDLLHAGHLRCLQEAARMGDVLVVAVNSDRSVRELKGSDRPIIGQEQRAEMLAALECVDHVLVFDTGTPHELLRRLRPDVLVKGGTTDQIAGAEIVATCGGQVHQTCRLDGVSTTAILKRLGHQGAGNLPADVKIRQLKAKNIIEGKAPTRGAPGHRSGRSKVPAERPRPMR